MRPLFWEYCEILVLCVLRIILRRPRGVTDNFVWLSTIYSFFLSSNFSYGRSRRDKWSSSPSNKIKERKLLILFLFALTFSSCFSLASTTSYSWGRRNFQSSKFPCILSRNVIVCYDKVQSRGNNSIRSVF